MKRREVPDQSGLARMERDALVIERDFWVNQARTLQNQVQMWQIMYSNLLAEIAKGEVRPDVVAAVAEAKAALDAPLTSIEAIRAFTAEQKALTQGKYTGRHKSDSEPRLIGRIMGNKRRGETL